MYLERVLAWRGRPSERIRTSPPGSATCWWRSSRGRSSGDSCGHQHRSGSARTVSSVSQSTPCLASTPSRVSPSRAVGPYVGQSVAAQNCARSTRRHQLPSAASVTTLDASSRRSSSRLAAAAALQPGDLVLDADDVPRTEAPRVQPPLAEVIAYRGQPPLHANARAGP